MGPAATGCTRPLLKKRKCLGVNQTCVSFYRRLVMDQKTTFPWSRASPQETKEPSFPQACKPCDENTISTSTSALVTVLRVLMLIILVVLVIAILFPRYRWEHVGRDNHHRYNLQVQHQQKVDRQDDNRDDDDDDDDDHNDDDRDEEDDQERVGGHNHRSTTKRRGDLTRRLPGRPQGVLFHQ